MSPRCSARVAELQQPQALLGTLEGDFAKAFVGRILSSLPLDERLRAREVCRGWCALLEDASFWTRVDLSANCGVNPRFLAVSRLALALLRAACVRAKGNLQSVDLSGMYVGFQQVPFVQQWLDSASAADKASLRDLVAPPGSLSVDDVPALCRALPLCRVRCCVRCYVVEALPLLRREPPYELLSIGKLHVMRSADGNQAVLDLASALAGYNGMELIEIKDIPLTTRAVDALVGAAISAGIKDMDLEECGLSQTALPALGRLLQSPGFERLAVRNSSRALFEGPALPAFCEALRNSNKLQELRLQCVDFWADMAAATQLIAALEGLPALQTVSLWNNRTDGTPAVQRAAGECLARLIACSTCLRFLYLDGNVLGEAALTPIFEALRGNAGLVELSLYGEQISTVFACNVVLPAVRENTHLRRLQDLSTVTVWEVEQDPSLREVKDIMAARRLADEDAA